MIGERGGGVGGYPARVRMMKLSMIASDFGVSHAEARLRLAGKRSRAC
jgi:hypothetical protein